MDREGERERGGDGESILSQALYYGLRIVLEFIKQISTERSVDLYFFFVIYKNSTISMTDEHRSQNQYTLLGTWHGASPFKIFIS